MAESSELARALALIGRGAGALTGAIAAVLWAYAMWVPSTRSIFAGFSFAVAFLMLLFSLLAVIAAIRGHGNMMLAMFIASFLPVGAYLIQADHWLRWIGFLDLILLGAALSTMVAASLGRR
jgi:hypothetical protein